MSPESLHYIHPYIPNQYMMALRAVGEICQDYNHNKLFPALGFGAKLPNGQVSHEFFLNFHPTDPHCQGVEGIMDAYRRAIMTVTLYGPTNFSPVINHVGKFAAAAARDGSHYFVLLIITDGVITDFEQTKSAIVNASSLPMSIIIVGVGGDEFREMEVLDSDKYKLSAGGRTAERDIVQFVPFRNYIRGNNCELSQAALSKDVLKEIPAQLTAWMHLRNIEARPPQQIDPNRLPVQRPPPGAPNQNQQTGYPAPNSAGNQSWGHPAPNGSCQPPTAQMHGMDIGGHGNGYPGSSVSYPHAENGQQGYPSQTAVPQGGGAPYQPQGAYPNPGRSSASNGSIGQEAFYPVQQPGGAYPQLH